MQIIAHRGYWKEPAERNTALAFCRAFELGFGVETDVRDCCGQLVIAHDLPSSDAMLASQFFDSYQKIGCDLPLALNIKADGLQVKLETLLRQCSISHYFVFDMSIPDALQYLKWNIKVFTRQSECEQSPLSFYTESTGIWLDSFNEDWINKNTLDMHLSQGKQCCIVSPELHGREYLSIWQRYVDWGLTDQTENVMICTDYPEKAKEFFGG